MTGSAAQAGRQSDGPDAVCVIGGRCTEICPRTRSPKTPRGTGGPPEGPQAQAHPLPEHTCYAPTGSPSQGVGPSRHDQAPLMTKARASRGTSRFRKNFRPSRASCASPVPPAPSAVLLLACSPAGEEGPLRCRAHPHTPREAEAGDEPLPSFLPKPLRAPARLQQLAQHSPPSAGSFIHLSFLLLRGHHHAGQTGTEGGQDSVKRKAGP